MAVPFSEKFLVHMALPPMLSVGIFVAYFVSKVVKPPKAKANKSHRWAQTLKLLIALILFMYPGLSTKCFQMFKCLDIDGIKHQVLEADPSMECDAAEHILYMTLSIVFIGVYIIGIPLTMFVVLWRSKKYLFVAKGEEPTEKQIQVEFELGGLYTQCELIFSTHFLFQSLISSVFLTHIRHIFLL